MKADRTLSLVPDATAWMRFVGLVDRLAGGTVDCPERAGRPELEVCTSPGVRTPPPRALVPDEPPVRDPERDLDLEKILRLDPHIVIVDTWNERWSVDPGVWLGERLGHAVEVWPWAVRTLRDALEQGLKLGRRYGVMERAMKVMGDREAELMVARRETGLHRRAPDASLEPVLVVSSLDPPAAAAGWAAETVDRAAVRLVTGRSGEPAHAAAWETLPIDEAERIVVVLPGQSAEEACRSLDNAAGATALARCGTVLCYDGRDRFDGAGPGLYDAALDLMALFHDTPGRAVADRIRRWTGVGSGTAQRA